jgi:hypothetical protein
MEKRFNFAVSGRRHDEKCDQLTRRSTGHLKIQLRHMTCFCFSSSSSGIGEFIFFINWLPINIFFSSL